MFSIRKPLVICALTGGLMLPLATRADDNAKTTPANQGTVGSNAASSSDKLSSADEHFVTDAANGGMAEVKLGELATQRAQSKDVKQFGQMMVDDHSKANDQLKALAQKKGVQVPSDIKGDEKQNYDKLQKTAGADFDREYVRLMLEDHQKDVADFKKEAQDGKDADVKAWAAQTLPTLEQHLTHVEKLAQSMGIQTGARTAGEKQGPDAANSTRSTGSASPQQPGPGNQDKPDNKTGGTNPPQSTDNKK